jgi:hypothetical protein
VASPTFPLTAAERFVDFPAHANHIMLQRARLDRSAQTATRRLAYVAADYRFHSYPAQLALAMNLGLRLGATASFGFREARRELAAQREHRKSEPILASYQIPDAGIYGRVAQAGIAAVRAHARERARRTAAAVAYAASAAAATVEGRDDKIIAVAAATQAALKTLHNHVLELVGETLNMGRTAGALSLKNPPEFALRSEQLDKATCELCTREHGEIYQVASSDYWAHLPPTYCLGGGRCRGLMIFGYGPEDVRVPEPSEEDLALLRKAA